jgi:hypothetical protein
MIRYKEDPSTTIIFIFGVLLLVGATLFMTVGPQPTTAGLAKQRKDAELKVQVEARKAQDDLAVTQVRLSAGTWAGQTQEVGPAALARVTQIANARSLKLVAFRPQRANEKTKPVQLPYLVTVEGSYPNVLEFIRSVDGAGTKLAVSLVQISSSDANSDRVTANIGIVAYLADPQFVQSAEENNDDA